MKSYDVPGQIFDELIKAYGLSNTKRTDGSFEWNIALLNCEHKEVGFSGAIALMISGDAKSTLILSDFGTWWAAGPVHKSSVEDYEILRVCGENIHGQLYCSQVSLRTRDHRGFNLSRPSGKFGLKIIERAAELEKTVEK